MAEESPPAAAPRSVLGIRDFRLFLTARFLSSVASQMQAVGVAVQIYDLTNSPLSLGLVGLAQFLPMAGLTLPAGDLADRYDRRLLLIGGYILQAVSAVMLLGLTVAGTASAGPFYAVLLLFGAARGLTGPSQQAIAPLLVPKELFPNAVGWSGSAMTVATIAGPSIGGVVYLAGPAALYAICVALYVTMALAVGAIRTRSAARVIQAGESSLRRVIAGIAYVWARPVILGSITLDLFAVLLGGATALLPVYARDILHVGPEGLGVLRSAMGVGAALTGIYLAQRPLRRHGGAAMFISVAVFGIATIVFGLSHSFILSFVALIVLGSSDMVSVYVRATTTQLATADTMRGRVSSVSMLFVGASNELGEFESGVTAAWFGAVPAVVLGGVGTLLVVAICTWRFPELRRIDRLTEVSPT